MPAGLAGRAQRPADGIRGDIVEPPTLRAIAAARHFDAARASHRISGARHRPVATAESWHRMRLRAGPEAARIVRRPFIRNANTGNLDLLRIITCVSAQSI
jgi:hypothetical protein